MIGFDQPRKMSRLVCFVCWFLSFFKKYIQEYLQSTLITAIRLDVLLGLILVQTVCKGLSAWGAQWLSGRVLDSRLLRLRSCRFERHRRHCIVSFSKTHYHLLSTGSTLKDPPRHDLSCPLVYSLTCSWWLGVRVEKGKKVHDETWFLFIVFACKFYIYNIAGEW